MARVTKLKLRLLQKGISQRQVAKVAGIHESTLSLIVTGKYLPKQNQIDGIARAVGEEPEELFETIVSAKGFDDENQNSK